MPITRKEFEKGRKITPAEDSIRKVLQENPDKAYTSNELARELGHTFGQDFWKDVFTGVGITSILDTLVREGFAVKREIGFETYYKLKV